VQYSQQSQRDSCNKLLRYCVVANDIKSR